MKLKIKVFCSAKLYGGVGWIMIKNFEEELLVSSFCLIRGAREGGNN